MKYSTLLLFCMILLSCKNEEEEFHSLQFDAKGIDLSYNKTSGVLESEIPAEGSMFTLTGKGKYSDLVNITSIEIDGIPQLVEGTEGSHSILCGEWGEIEYLTDLATCTIEFRINANDNDTTKNIDIQIEYRNRIYHLNLKQSTAKIEWDNIVFNQLSANEIFIGNQYLGIQNWNCPGNPPLIYPSAIFLESDFANSFDKEMMFDKNPISLYTDSRYPFVSTINSPSGANYQQFLKEMLNSEEYVSNNLPRLDLFRICNLGTPENLKMIFKNNKKFANTILDMIQQRSKTNKLQNWVLAEIVFRGISVTMDTPSEPGLLKNKSLEAEGMVYVRSITYGATAYLIIGSSFSYNEIKNFITTPSLAENTSQKLSESSIIFISNSTLGQNAELSTSFDSLNSFMKEPCTAGNYGYPIYCTGCYINDNSFFHINTTY